MSTAKRMINANELRTQFDNIPPYIGLAGSLVQQYIDKAPTVDAEEVVRCKDCKHWHEETGWCNHHSHFVNTEGEACHPWESPEWKMLHADDFCSYGERRADENET